VLDGSSLWLGGMVERLRQAQRLEKRGSWRSVIRIVLKSFRKSLSERRRLRKRWRGGKPRRIRRLRLIRRRSPTHPRQRQTELGRVITALLFCSGHPYIVASIDKVRVYNSPIILPDEPYPNTQHHHNKSLIRRSLYLLQPSILKYKWGEKNRRAKLLQGLVLLSPTNVPPFF
jgi:hypothetical protein